MSADDGWICPLCSADPDAAAEAVEEFAGELCRGLDAAGVPGVPDAHTAVEQVQRRILALVKSRVG